MSYEIVNEKESLGPLASNKGLIDLREASKGIPALERLFEDGQSKEVEEIIAGLKTIKSPPDVVETARNMARLIEGSEDILITDGITHYNPDDVGKSDESINDSEPESVLKAGNGVMIALFPPEEVADELALGTEESEDPDEMHVTLAYFGKLSEIDIKEIPSIELKLQQFAAAHGPVTGTLDGPMRFSSSDSSEGRDVVVALFNSKEIQDLRTELLGSIETPGTKAKNDFGYTPHITLAYVDPSDDLPIQRLEPISVTFDSITLCVAGKRTSYELSGVPETELAKLDEAIWKEYNQDQPRGEHGRWSSTGAATDKAEQTRRIQAVLDKSDADPKVQMAERTNMLLGDSRMDPSITDSKGNYTPEAHAENQRIADSFLDPSFKNPPGTAPTAVFLLGKPGAGKTTMTKAIGTLPKSVTINSDEIKDKLPGYTGSNAAAYHERSCDIARNYLERAAIEGRYNVTFDMTDNQDRLLRTAEALKADGYKIGIIHAHVDDATSAERVYGRFQRTGRYVPVRAAMSYGNRPKQAYNLGKTVAHQWREYDTSGKPKVTNSGGRGVF